MIEVLRKFWGATLAPMLQRPKRLQVAALCHRTKGDDTEVLLVTSRDTGRWIIPKGWPIRGLKSSEAALQEAWEEAGVRNSKATPAPIGTYTYDKRQSTGWDMPVETLVYSVSVNELSEEFPEAHERTRKWVLSREAADMVAEPELQMILRQL
ncbi:NUDIX hydrolase [Pseudosulfitobacter pseudonitzschiae]|uniref:NUDIX hydrolase n=1 Tax=Pseudosulfitobacter pseudonitzschiae TaxID=1402135 RepID=A0A073J574_9RHOB|nr:NUDIX hydrolase [Pseudosulfitobacter pseudonitzschiae]KEJ96856.1 NUDIX hydrolase [Pseudosulfitobacter pseudonitzschiae]MBM1817787.1 NUDIX hydrolase [Pseudosulfitobacter pseudonitzschiae]MBM1834845.1 NUDIX hydrolase [Pseudosulfitobacter pseudonitzschiae]MBM1839646.1 NUDIX hydrolase [Pseudosulfitobacter pseudonitzschiae]MBM1844560.1 NUDIX hydrolase [Pseudosulfitobacter pseudonitzschiae]